MTRLAIRPCACGKSAGRRVPKTGLGTSPSGTHKGERCFEFPGSNSRFLPAQKPANAVRAHRGCRPARRRRRVAAALPHPPFLVVGGGGGGPPPGFFYF